MHFTVYYDKASLQWTQEISEPSSRLMPWHMRLCKYDFEDWYKKNLFETQANDLFCLRFFDKTADPIDADIPASLLQRDVTPTRSVITDDPNVSLILATNTSSSFVPTTFEEIRLSQNDDSFCRSKRTRLGERRWIFFAYNGTSILFCYVNGFEQATTTE